MNLGKHFFHFFFGFICDDTVTDGIIAVFGGVADGITHKRKPARNDKVNNELHFMHAFKVSVFRLITGFDKRIESRLHQSGNAAAKYGLLTEKVGFRFFAEGGF